MATTITISSPTEILGESSASAAPQPNADSTPTTGQQQSPCAKRSTPSSKNLNGTGKPKQTKSRNGCVTCKDKRLKCDEIKPTCQQCSRRGVQCKGYKKVFQWRPEEKATFRSAPTRTRRRSTITKHSQIPPSLPPKPEDLEGPKQHSEDENSAPTCSFPAKARSDLEISDKAITDPAAETKENSPLTSNALRMHEDADGTGAGDDNNPDISGRPSTLHSPAAGFTDFVLDLSSSFGQEESAPSSAVSLFAPIYNDEWTHSFRSQSHHIPYEQYENDIEEMERANEYARLRLRSYPSPTPSNSSSASGGSPDRFSEMLQSPLHFALHTTDMLASQFSELTCGILSIKDGPNENPWRTMILPMAADFPCLHHAILSMAAFHLSRENPQFRPVGIKHMNKSIHYLVSQLSGMRRDTALATSLALAFSESWDEEISTGMKHLRGARKLVAQAVANHEGNADFDELERLKFLRNTWVYMDVIARITALDCDDLDDLDTLFAPVYGPADINEDIDPLMGCATTLFPLLGRVANLVRRIRKTRSSSPTIVARAASLRSEILKWKAPTHFRIPRDESIEVDHGLKTAEAYRWATLLFLYQAVPMIATESLPDLAEKIMYYLVCVPISSRVLIIHIFPLLIAGCELVYEDNRQLVEERWISMIQRMTIGNLDRCWDVVHEVWRRRDARSAELGADEYVTRAACDATCSSVAKDDNERTSSPEALSGVELDFTVRGSCHWLTIMQEWNWAVLLG